MSTSHPDIELTQHIGKVELPESAPRSEGRYLAGELIDNRYEVDSLLGVGGMGEVYKVFDTQDGGRILALKVLLKDAISFSDKKRFEREIDVTSKLNNPSVVNCFEHGKVDGRPYFTMECIEGVTLRDLIGKDQEGKPLPLQEILKILIQCASGLYHAHTRGVVHRDIKPENIMVTKDGTAKVTDFGIGRSLDLSDGLTRTNEMVGTIFYMSPEQLKGSEPLAQSDIYSLGLLAFELATGKRAFYDPENQHAVYIKHLSENVPSMRATNRKVPAWFQRFVEHCSEKEVKDRFQTMLEVAQALLPHLSSSTRRELLAIQAAHSKYKENSGHPVDNGNSLREPALLLGNGFRPSLIDSLTLFWRGTKRSIRASVRGGSPIRYAGALAASLLHVYLLCPVSWLPYSGLIGSHIEPYAMDAWFAIRGEIAPPKDVFLVVLDDQSYSELHESPLKPWPRRRMAELLEKIAPYSPKAIVLDFRFTGATDPVDDSRFEKALSLSKTYVGKALSFARRRGTDGKKLEAPSELHSDENFVRAAAGEFMLSRPIDSGTMRRFRNGDDEVGSIPEVITARRPEELPSPRDYLNYYGSPGAIVREPFSVMLNASPEFLESNIRGKVVFIGQHLELEYYQHETDTFLTPYRLLSPGVEIHATAAGNILDNSWIRRISPEAEVLYAVFLAALLAYLLSVCSPPSGALLLVVLAVTWAVLSYYFFLHHYFLPGLTLVFFVLPAVYTVLLVRHYYNSRSMRLSFGLTDRE